jgi:hypothetical protein
LAARHTARESGECSACTRPKTRLVSSVFVRVKFALHVARSDTASPGIWFDTNVGTIGNQRLAQVFFEYIAEVGPISPVTSDTTSIYRLIIHLTLAAPTQEIFDVLPSFLIFLFLTFTMFLQRVTQAEESPFRPNGSLARSSCLVPSLLQPLARIDDFPLSLMIAVM